MGVLRRPLMLFTAIAALGLASYALAQVGPPGGVIYANDQMYQTVATPAHFTPHGKFDTIYVLGGGRANVADAAPGDMEFNGGRWEVRAIQWNIDPVQFTNAAQVHAAAMAGDIEIGPVMTRFECPLIPIN